MKRKILFFLIQLLSIILPNMSVGQTTMQIKSVVEGDSLWNIDIERSIQIYRKTLHHDPTNDYARNQLAHAYRVSEQYNLAINEFVDLVETPEYGHEVLFYIADAYFSLRQFEAGISYLEKSIDSGFNNLYNSGFSKLSTILSSDYYDELKENSHFRRLYDKIQLLPFDPIIQYTSWSPDADKLVMQASFSGGGSYDLYVYDFVTKDLQRLTYTRESEMAPKWSPDGLWIAFHRAGLYSGAKELFLIRPDGTMERNLTDQDGLAGNKSFPTWSHDSDRIIFVSEQQAKQHDLYQVTVDGTQYTRLTDSRGMKSNPCLSPDNVLIYDVQLTDNSYSIEQYDLNTEITTTLTTKNWWWTPVWINEGRQVLCGYYEVGASRLNQLVVMNADGSNVQSITDYGIDAWFPSPSATGSKIAFASPINPYFEGGAILKIIDLESGQIEDLILQ